MPSTPGCRAEGAAIGLVVAGGEGRRMALSGVETPKPLIRVRGRTLLEHAAAHLARHGIHELHVALCHRADEILRALAGGPARSASWIVERQPLGTIGSLQHLAGAGRPIVVVNGDLVTDLDLSALLADHHASGAAITVATHDFTSRLAFGEVLPGLGGAVMGIDEKPEKRYRIFSGISVFAPAVTELLVEGESLGVPELVQRAVDEGLTVRQHHHHAEWFDLNRAVDVDEVSRHLDTTRGSWSANPLPLASGG